MQECGNVYLTCTNTGLKMYYSFRQGFFFFIIIIRKTSFAYYKSLTYSSHTVQHLYKTRYIQQLQLLQFFCVFFDIKNEKK